MQKQFELEKLFSLFTSELNANVEDYLMNYLSANGKKMPVTRDQVQLLFPLIKSGLEEGLYKITDRYTNQVKDLVQEEVATSTPKKK